MKFRSNSKQAIIEHKNAREELDRVSRRDRTETPAVTRAHQRVIESEKNVSWFRR